MFITFLLWVNYILFFYPFRCLFLVTAVSLLFDRHQSLCLEVVLLSIKDSGLNNSFGFMLRLQFKSLSIYRGFEDTLNYSILWNIFEGSTYYIHINNSLLLLRVIVRTWTFLAALQLALCCLIMWGMILLLFPTMTHVAIRSKLATTIVVIDVVLSLPVEARLN